MSEPWPVGGLVYPTKASEQREQHKQRLSGKQMEPWAAKACRRVLPGKETLMDSLRSDSCGCLCSPSTPYWQENGPPGASVPPPLRLKVTLSWSAGACRSWTTCPPRYSVKFAPGKPPGATQAMWMGSSWLLGCGGTSRMDGAGIAKEPAIQKRGGKLNG